MATRLNLHAGPPVGRAACRPGDTDRKTRPHELAAICSALLGACLWLGISTAAAAETGVELAPAPANVTEHTIKLGVTALSATVQLRNSGKEIRYYRTDKLLTHAGDGATRPATWKREGAAAEDKTIAPGAQIALELSAELPIAGTYETFIDTLARDKGVEVLERRIRVLVIREADALPAEFIVDTKPATETWPWNYEPRHYLLTLRNATTKRLSFTPPKIVELTEKSGDELTTAGSSKKPSLDTKDCHSPLDPTISCQVYLTVNNMLGPGEHQINVGVAGEGGGWSQRTQTIRVKATGLLAFAVIVVGAFAGSYVQAWRNRGRPVIAALIELSRLREAALRLGVPADDKLMSLIRPVLADIDDVESQARRDVDVTTEIERLRLWIRFLIPATELRRRFGKLPGTGQSALQAQFAAVMREAEKPKPSPAERDAQDTLIHAAADNLNDWPGLELSITKAAPVLAAIDTLLGAVPLPPADLAALKAVHDDLATAVNTAKAPLPVPPVAGGSVSERQIAVDAAIKKAEQQALVAAEQIVDELSAAKLHELDGLPSGDPKEPALQASIRALAAWKAGAGKPIVTHLRDLTDLLRPARKLAAAPAPGPATPGLPPGVSPIDIPTQILVPPPGASLLQLQTSQSNNERITNLILLGATGLAGVLALWVPSATWGSCGDVIGAFMAGLAARVVLGDAGSTVK